MLNSVSFSFCPLPVLNCVRLLTRVLPYIFEDPEWRGFFWSAKPGQPDTSAGAPDNPPPLAQSLLGAVLVSYSADVTH